MKNTIEFLSCELFDKNDGVNGNGITLLPREYITYHAKIKMGERVCGVSYNVFKTTFYPLGEQRSMEIAKEQIIKYLQDGNAS